MAESMELVLQQLSDIKAWIQKLDTKVGIQNGRVYALEKAHALLQQEVQGVVTNQSGHLKDEKESKDKIDSWSRKKILFFGGGGMTLFFVIVQIALKHFGLL